MAEPKILVERSDGTAIAAWPIKVRKCQKCARWIIPAQPHQIPGWAKQKVIDTAAANGLGISTSRFVDPLCDACDAHECNEFKCTLCKITRPKSEERESFGWPSESVCEHCYATVPAKAWDAEIERLEREHRFDFE